MGKNIAGHLSDLRGLSDFSAFLVNIALIMESIGIAILQSMQTRRAMFINNLAMRGQVDLSLSIGHKPGMLAAAWANCAKPELPTI